MAYALTAPPRAAQVGKTSLILSLVGEEFPAEVRGTRGRSPRCGSRASGRPHAASPTGPSPRRGDHHPRRRHPGEGAHAHRGLLRWSRPAALCPGGGVGAGFQPVPGRLPAGSAAPVSPSLPPSPQKPSRRQRSSGTRFTRCAVSLRAAPPLLPAGIRRRSSGARGLANPTTCRVPWALPAGRWRGEGLCYCMAGQPAGSGER